MKRKFFIVVFLILIIKIGAYAASIDQATARRVAQTYYSFKAQKFNRSNSINEEFVILGNGGKCCYIFNFDEQGFVIVSAEDTYTPIIGYSLFGRYVPNQMSDGFKYLLDSYKRIVEYSRSDFEKTSMKYKVAWSALLNNRPENYPRNGSKGVDNLMKSTWDQIFPYNYLCPADDAGFGGHVPAGCVATAMSQIMFYWRWPNVGVGLTSYVTPDYGTLTANLGDTQYQFSGMVHSSPDMDNFYIAQLLSHVGIALKTDYGPTGSFAILSYVPTVFERFRYNSGINLNRSGFNSSQWEDMIKSDLDLGRVIFYKGYNSDNACHTFVCSGYTDDSPTLYYFNFGWSGSNDGYYTLDDVGGFFTNQGMVNQIVPNNEYPTSAPDTNEYKYLVGTIEDGSGPVVNYLPNKTISYLISPQNEQDSISKIILNFKRYDLGVGDELKIYNGGDRYAPLIGTYNTYNIPTTITSASNKLYLVFTTDNDNEGNGWLCEYSSVQPAWCSSSKTFTNPSGTFDDGSGHFDYNDNTTCMFKINVPSASQININFNYFDTNDDNDVLKIMNGSLGNQLITALSGSYSNPPASIVIPGSKATLMFQTDSYFHANGWELTYTALCVGIESQNLLSNFRLWPNPASEILNVDFDVDQQQTFQIKLMDVTGKELYSQVESNYSGRYRSSISVRAFPTGIYFFIITGDNGSFTSKVIVK